VLALALRAQAVRHSGGVADLFASDNGPGGAAHVAPDGPEAMTPRADHAGIVTHIRPPVCYRP
jgi:hypothetical protein